MEKLKKILGFLLILTYCISCVTFWVLVFTNSDAALWACVWACAALMAVLSLSFVWAIVSSSLDATVSLELVAGDLVKLKSGGPLMVVDGHHGCLDALCKWVDSAGELKFGYFRPQVLKRAK